MSDTNMATNVSGVSPGDSVFTSYQKYVIALLAFIQFTVILDFMVMAPLGAIMMPALQMDPSQFGTVVSAYAFSAGTASLLAAGFADRYDRKKLLLFFYVGFIIGTLLCGLASNYQFMLLARIVTGLFGGVLGSIVMAITTDLFTLEKRGRVMGFIQTAFAASQILGLPAGLYLSNRWGWHAPFFMIVAVSLFVGIFIVLYLRPVDGHLSLHVDRNPFHHLWTTITNRHYLFAFLATALLSIGGFLLMPFGSAFTVQNLKIGYEHLATIYLITGLCSIAIGPLVGKAADRFGKYPTFVFGSTVSIITVLIYTHMGESSLVAVIGINVIMFVGIFSRMIPSQALTSAIPTPASRGSFMSVGSSLQQIAGGIAAVVGGFIVVQNGKDSPLEHYDVLGYIMTGTALTTVIMMYYINRSVQRQPKH